jgi:hypothetical protein
MYEGDTVTIQTVSGTLLTAKVNLVSVVKRSAPMGIHGETHMFGVVQGGPISVDAKGGMTDKIFAVKGTVKKQEPTNTSNDVAEDEWD